jgi:phospholipid/cholesterol/gamma-HCH transport system permease protein
MNIRSRTYFGLFFRQIFSNLGFKDILPAFAKTFVFGFAVGIVGSYKGYNSKNGTQGVGSSANSAVVLSSILIFIIDLIAVQITNLLDAN